MIKRNLAVMVILDVVLLVAFVLDYLKQRSLVPLYVGILPLALFNFIFVREFIRPAIKVEKQPPVSRSTKRRNIISLFIMPIGFFFTLPALIKFDGSLGWPPVVCFGFSVLLCIVIIAFYGGVKTALSKNNS